MAPKAPPQGLRESFGEVLGSFQAADSTRKVLLVGQRGAGKTSFLQLLRSLHAVADNKVASENILQMPCADPAATQRAEVAEVTLGAGGAPLIVIDLPGWQDTEGTQQEGEQDQEHARHIREAAASAQELHCVVLVVNGTLARAQPSIDHSLRELAKVYPLADIKQRAVVLFTFCDSLQRRAFPVTEDKGLLGEIARQEQLCFYLDNPLGRLAGLKKEDLEAQFAAEAQCVAANTPADEYEELAAAGAEVRREVKKGAQSAVKLLKHVSSSALATPALATVPPSFRPAATVPPRPATPGGGKEFINKLLAAEKEAERLLAKGKEDRKMKLQNAKEAAEKELQRFKAEQEAAFELAKAQKEAESKSADRSKADEREMAVVEEDFKQNKAECIKYIVQKVLDVPIALTTTQTQALKTGAV